MLKQKETNKHQRSQIIMGRDTSRDLSVGSYSKSPSRVVNGIKLYNFS